MKHERLVNEIYWAVEHGDLKEADKLVEDVIGKATKPYRNAEDKICELIEETKITEPEGSPVSRVASLCSWVKLRVCITCCKPKAENWTGECPECEQKSLQRFCEATAKQDAGECPNCGRLLTECNGNCIFSSAQEDKNV